MRGASGWVGAWTALSLAFAAPARAAGPPVPDAAKVEFTYAVSIPLRDGVSLAATLYRPRAEAAPAPCVFTLTPYTRQTYHDRGVYFGAHGVPFLTVDVRGRGDSGGTFRANIQEAQDGYDVVEWLARQPYCDGHVSMWGGSYAGYDQWQTAKLRPPHLSTIVPVAAPYAARDFPFQRGIIGPYILQWLTYTSGKASQSALFGDSAFWNALNLDHYLRDAPFRDYAKGLGIDQPQLREWIDHRDDAGFWAAYNATDAQLKALDIPILTVTGAYDGDQPGALHWYRQAMAQASPEQKARMFLVIGPWDHPGTRTPRLEVGGLAFGPASLVDLPKLHLDWYGWTMAGGARPEFLKKPVAYYVAGADIWRYAETLAAVTAEARPFALSSAGSADDPLHSGLLAPGVPAGPPDRYVYDPRDTGPGRREVSAPDTYLTDEAPVLAGAGRELVYTSAPLAADTEVSGEFRLRAWIAIDRPDTDFDVSIYQLEPGGRSVYLSGDRIRARYREGEFKPKPITTTAPLNYDFDRFTFVSRLLPKGSRLRLVIAPLNSINWEKNHNSGKPVEDETSADAQTVTVSLVHDAAHPSTLYVPIGQPR